MDRCVRVAHDVARAILAPEVSSGLLTGEEAEAVIDRRRRKALLRGADDQRERRRRQQVAEAARDLVQELAIAKGAATAEVTEVRSEIARLRDP